MYPQPADLGVNRYDDDSRKNKGSSMTKVGALCSFGDDDQLETLTGDPRFKCPKTWGHDGSASKESVKAAKGSCGDPSKCGSGGCFDASKPVHVHLKKH